MTTDSRTQTEDGECTPEQAECTPEEEEKWRQHLTQYSDFSGILKGLLQRGHVVKDVLPFKLDPSGPYDDDPSVLEDLQDKAADSGGSAEAVLTTKLNEMLRQCQCVSCSA